jgi:hypothetical protein
MNCKFCQSQNDADAVFCKNCGSRIVAETSAPAAQEPASQSTFFEANPYAPAPTKKKLNPVVLIAAIAAAAIVVIAVIGLASNNPMSSSDDYSSSETWDDTSTESLVPDTSWVPAGYTLYDDNIAYKWTTQEGSDPCSDCNFWKVKVVPHYGCSNGVYGEINMLDASETRVDWTNDSLPSLGAGETGLLVFENYPWDDSIDTGELVELNCHP